MNRLSLRLALGVVVAASASASVAQTIGAGPYYATPSWDQTFPVATRFIVLTNLGSEAVLDRETGLVWQRTPIATGRSFSFSMSLCLGAATGGRFGWRLPTAPELRSLFDPLATASPYLPAGHPFTVPPGDTLFWSTTIGAQNTAGNFLLFMVGTNVVGGFSTQTASEDYPGVAWCVRGPGDAGRGS